MLLGLSAVVALGLLSRRFPLPGLLAEHTGDALYTVAAFLLCAAVFPAAGSASLALGAFAWSALVEAAQLWTWPWLQDLRSTTAGALLLGQGFQWADLAAYGVGAVAIGVWDGRARAARRRREVF